MSPRPPTSSLCVGLDRETSQHVAQRLTRHVSGGKPRIGRCLDNGFLDLMCGQSIAQSEANMIL